MTATVSFSFLQLGPNPPSVVTIRVHSFSKVPDDVSFFFFVLACLVRFATVGVLILLLLTVRTLRTLVQNAVSLLKGEFFKSFQFENEFNARMSFPNSLYPPNPQT